MPEIDPSSLFPSLHDSIRLPRTAATAQWIKTQQAGRVFFVDGLAYTRNDAMTGAAGTATASATLDLGVNGVAPAIYVTPEHYGENTTPATTDMTDALRSSMRYAAANRMPFQAHGAYRASGTIGALETLMGTFSEVTIVFDLSEPTNYEIIRHNPSGPNYTDSDKRVCFDTRGMANSHYSGDLKIVASNSPSSMNAAGRASITENMVGFAASDFGDTGAGEGGGSGDFSSASVLTIEGFDYALWRGDFDGSAGRAVLPYTGLNFTKCHIIKCRNFAVWGQSANGSDTIHFDQFRITRCTGTWKQQSTEFSCDQFFAHGLDRTLDAEPGTIALTAASTTATLSEDNPDLAVGDIIMCPDGGAPIKAGGVETAFSARIEAKSGTTLTLSRAAGATQAATTYMVNPPTIEIIRSAFLARVFYLEKYWGRGIEAGVGAQIEGNVAVAGGPSGYYYGAPITVTGRENVHVDVAVGARSVGIRYAERIVAVGSVRGNSGDAYSSARVNVTIPVAEGTDYAGAEVIALDSEDITQNVGFNSDGSVDYNNRLNITEVYTDRKLLKAPTAGNGVIWREHKGSPYLLKVADLDGDLAGGADLGGTVVAAEGAALSGSVPQTGTLDGTDERISLALDLLAETAYLAVIETTGHAVGNVELQLFEDVTARGARLAQIRMDGQYVVRFDTPTDAVNRVTLTSTFNGECTITRFDLYKLEEM